MLGAAVGSFLNVVVYRLPRGMSLVRPKSRCPGCGASIRPGDNVPVLGWLRLRGRCRACGGAISARYPFVEAVTALLFLGLAHFELFSGGANLPGAAPATGDLSFVLWYVRPALIGQYLYHVTLAATLLCLSLIAWDGFPPPRKLVAAGVLIGLLVPLFVPVRPVPSGIELPLLPHSWIPLGTAGGVSFAVFPRGLLEGGLGAAAGAILGGLTSAAVPSNGTRSADRAGTAAAGLLIGLFLGWQAAVGCGVFAAAFSMLAAVASRATSGRLPMTAITAASVLVQLPFWRRLNGSRWWPNFDGWGVLRHVGWPESGFTATSLVAAAAVAAGLAWTAGRIGSRSGDRAAVPAEPSTSGEPAPSSVP